LTLQLPTFIFSFLNATNLKTIQNKDGHTEIKREKTLEKCSFAFSFDLYFGLTHV